VRGRALGASISYSAGTERRLGTHTAGGRQGQVGTSVGGPLGCRRRPGSASCPSAFVTPIRSLYSAQFGTSPDTPVGLRRSTTCFRRPHSRMPWILQ